MSDLTRAEVELLVCLSEECSEVATECFDIIKMIGKTLWDGYESTNLFMPELGANRDKLECKIADILAIIKIMADAKHIDMEKIIMHAEAKRQKIKQYLHYN